METRCITELGEKNAEDMAKPMCNEFDNTIYPNVTDLAGHPNGTMGDIDGDPRIVILLSSNKAAYYSEANDIVHQYSNLCEMIYLYYKQYRWNWCLALMAHEFHHLIWFNNEWDEPPFMVEALAQYAMYYAGYFASYDDLAPQVEKFLSSPEDSLLYWNSDNSNDYGSAYLFAFYIAEHYGVDILRNLITEPADGPHGVEAVLQAAGFNITFNELYLNWITALTIDEVGFDENLYGFDNIDARITQYNIVDDFPLLDETISLRYYGFYIHKLESPPDNLTIRINKSSNQTIGLSIALHDAFGWHVHQKIHDETNTIVIDDFMGHSSDVAYIITSYMLDHTPTTIKASYGLGPSTDIEISITQTPITTNTNQATTDPSINTSSGLNIITALFSLITLIILFQKAKKY